MLPLLAPILFIAASHFVANWFLPRMEGRASFVAYGTGICFWPVLVWYAMWATVGLGVDASTRVHGLSLLSTQVMQAYVSYTTGSIINDVLSGSSSSSSSGSGSGSGSGFSSSHLLSLLHHLFTAAGMVYGLQVEKFHFYACATLLVEVSSPPLYCVLLLTQPNTSARRLQRTLPEETQLVCGGVLWLTYFVFRILLCPLLLILLLYDSVYLHNQDDVGQMRRYFLYMSSALVGLVVLNCIWFLKIHDGMISALRSPA